VPSRALRPHPADVAESPPTPASTLLAAAALGVLALVGLHLARGLAYWNYSEGVYALTARLLREGHDVYGDVVAAQPPWPFVAGAAALALGDSIAFLRSAVGAAQLCTGILTAAAVWRLTANRAATIAAPALALSTPWAVHEHGALTPETLAPPLLLGAALASTRRRWVALGGVLAAVTPFIKLPFLLAVPPIVLLSEDPWRAARWASGALVVQAVGFTAVFGPGLWEYTVMAQLDSPLRGVGVLVEMLGQAGWNLACLLALSVVAVLRRARAEDQALMTSLTGLAVAVLIVLATVGKEGTSLTILVPVEAVLLPLALTGAVVALRPRATALAVGGVGAALLIVLAQTASLLTATPTATPFVAPTAARGAWGMEMSASHVDRQVEEARHCSPGVPYNGPPFIAFVARRRMPADQPDQFLTTHSDTLRAVRARMKAATPRCP
jgi:hypothetical protein